MKKDTAIALIKAIEPAVRALGAVSLYLFGSTARDQAKASSDVDIFVDWDPRKRLGLVEFTDLEELLEQTLGSKVDLATRTSLHPVLRGEIERTAVRVL